MTPVYLQLVTLKEIPYDSRSVKPLDQSTIKTVLYGQSIPYDCVKLWNNLPNHFKMYTSLTDFKRIISTWNGPPSNCQACVLCSLRVAHDFISNLHINEE